MDLKKKKKKKKNPRGARGATMVDASVRVLDLDRSRKKLKKRKKHAPIFLNARSSLASLLQCMLHSKSAARTRRHTHLTTSVHTTPTGARPPNQAIRRPCCCEEDDGGCCCSIAGGRRGPPGFKQQQPHAPCRPPTTTTITRRANKTRPASN